MIKNKFVAEIMKRILNTKLFFRNDISPFVNDDELFEHIKEKMYDEFWNLGYYDYDERNKAAEYFMTDGKVMVRYGDEMIPVEEWEENL